MDASSSDILPPRLAAWHSLSRQLHLQAVDYIELIAQRIGASHAVTADICSAMLSTSEALDLLLDQEPPVIEAR
jgi:hypothetical protein